jgi:WD40 repeat protein
VQAEIVRVLTKEKESLILTGHTGYVQGVAWDPLGEMVVTQSADRTFKAHMVSRRKKRGRRRGRRRGRERDWESSVSEGCRQTDSDSCIEGVVVNTWLTDTSID